MTDGNDGYGGVPLFNPERAPKDAVNVSPESKKKASKYTYTVAWLEEDEAYVARVAEFKLLAAHGKTAASALAEIEKVVYYVLMDLEENGEAISKPKENGPEIDSNGTKRWYQNGLEHRDNDLPAVEYANGSKEWYSNGKRHRDNDLPACEWANGDKSWYQNGKQVDEPKENGHQCLEVTITELEAHKEMQELRDRITYLKKNNQETAREMTEARERACMYHDMYWTLRGKIEATFKNHDKETFNNETLAENWKPIHR